MPVNGQERMGLKPCMGPSTWIMRMGMACSLKAETGLQCCCVGILHPTTRDFSSSMAFNLHGVITLPMRSPRRWRAAEIERISRLSDRLRRHGIGSRSDRETCSIGMMRWNRIYILLNQSPGTPAGFHPLAEGCSASLTGAIPPDHRS